MRPQGQYASYGSTAYYRLDEEETCYAPVFVVVASLLYLAEAIAVAAEEGGRALLRSPSFLATYAIIVSVVSLVVCISMVAFPQRIAERKAMPRIATALFAWWLLGAVVGTVVGPFDSADFLNGYVAAWVALFAAGSFAHSATVWAPYVLDIAAHAVRLPASRRAAAASRQTVRHPAAPHGMAPVPNGHAGKPPFKLPSPPRRPSRTELGRLQSAHSGFGEESSEDELDASCSWASEVRPQGDPGASHEARLSAAASHRAYGGGVRAAAAAAVAIDPQPRRRPASPRGSASVAGGSVSGSVAGSVSRNGGGLNGGRGGGDSVDNTGQEVARADDSD